MGVIETKTSPVEMSATIKKTVEAYFGKRHRVAEYPLELPSHPTEKPLEAKPGSNLPSSITLEIQQDRLTKIAEESWIKTGGKLPEKQFDPGVVKEIYVTELKVTSGRKPIPLQRVTILEVSQYLEKYLWPNFDPETATFGHLMSMILMINDKELGHGIFGDEVDDTAGSRLFDDSSVLYCERFMEFLIDMLNQLPTRRYLRPIVADVAVVAKCRLSPLYKHEKGKLFAQLVDLLQFYEKFEIKDHDGTQLTDDEGSTSISL